MEKVIKQARDGIKFVYEDIIMNSIEQIPPYSDCISLIESDRQLLRIINDLLNNTINGINEDARRTVKLLGTTYFDRFKTIHDAAQKRIADNIRVKETVENDIRLIMKHFNDTVLNTYSIIDNIASTRMSTLINNSQQYDFECDNYIEQVSDAINLLNENHSTFKKMLVSEIAECKNQLVELRDNSTSHALLTTAEIDEIYSKAHNVISAIESKYVVVITTDMEDTSNIEYPMFFLNYMPEHVTKFITELVDKIPKHA